VPGCGPPVQTPPGVSDDQQPHAPPQQPPAPPTGPIGTGAPPPCRPASATVDSSFTVSPWPSGHGVGADDSAMGRLTSKVLPHARQRYSYRGMDLA
jgi:hypothetical protein